MYSRCAIAFAGLLLAPLALSPSGHAVAGELQNPGFEQAGDKGMPSGWGYYNWGAKESVGEAGRTTEWAHSGQGSLRAETRDGVARPGAYTRLDLQPGRYELRCFARAEEGRQALVRMYLADRYSPPRAVGDDWTQVAYRHTIRDRRLNAEINMQAFGGKPGVVWFDDVQLTPLPDAKPQVVPDPRPAADGPRLLYFSGNVSHVGDTAADWVARGFAGFLYSYLFHDWATNIWAQDGNPDSTGPDDLLLAEVQQALRTASDAGLDEHVLKVAFYTDLPDPFDDRAYATLLENFRQGARFALATDMQMLAIDTEYVAEQYHYTWEGYDYERYTRGELAAKIRQRWHEVGAVIAAEAPDMHVGVLPEGMIYYGPLWIELFAGLLEGLQEGQTQGNVHVLCEGTYSVREPEEIREHAASVRELTTAYLTGKARRAWDERGKLALGAWPLGYYRAIRDAGGKFLGWSGNKETFGNRIVGSYADKSARYPAEEFRTQLAAIRTFSDDYVWIYGHGSSWWQITARQAETYSQKYQAFPKDNYLVPTAADVKDYYTVASRREIIRFTGEDP